MLGKHSEGTIKVLEIAACDCDPVSKVKVVYELQPYLDKLMWRPVCPVENFERLYPDRVHELTT